ncbi:MAG: 3-oxoacyl-ACP reductase [Bacilli bacterium]|nr:3-oxoacyl-ACP reductase [Bacilli bacterium]
MRTNLAPLAGKTALVTGASRGIGRAIALHLAALGANIAITYLENRLLAETVAKQCESRGVKSVVLQADLADPRQVEDMVKTACLYVGKPLLLINNAGQTVQKTILDTSYAEWQYLMNLNAGAAFLLSKLVLPYMLEQQFGRIISIASVFGMVGGSGEVSYSASKGALLAFTKALAKEVGRTGVTVNAVAPGAIATDMLSGYSTEELLELENSHPVGRLGIPDDVANCVGFLALPSSSFMTGQVLSPNGGWIT